MVSSNEVFPSSVSSSAVNFTPKPKRDCLLCTHCGLQGHIVDKWYTLHGYPLGYKVKPKSSSIQAKAHQASSTITKESAIGTSDSPLTVLTTTQCQQLITLLSSQLQHSSRAPSEPEHPDSSVSSFSGIFFLSSTSHLPSFPSTSWVLDTSATHHVCCSLSLFTSSVSTENSFVTLPNGHIVPIIRIGSMHLSDHLILDNVLFVPQFQLSSFH